MNNKVKRFAGRLGIALATAAVVASSGCSLINPHLSIPPPATVAVPLDLPSDEQQLQQITFYGDLPLYIDYANEMRDEYYAAVGHQSLLRNGTALTLIPLAATALYLGIIGDAGTNTMAALGVTGAAAWGVSNYLESRPRQSVYLAGADEVGCAVLSVTPWLVTKEDFDALNDALNGYHDVNGSLKGLPIALQNARSALDRLRNLAAGYAASGIRDARIDAAIGHAESANTRIAEADATRKRGLALRREIRTAHIRLYNQLMKIRDEVSKQVVRTEPQLDEILGYIGSLAASSSIFAPTPLPAITPPEAALDAQSTAAPPTLDDDQARALKAAQSELGQALSSLAIAASPIVNLADQVDGAKSEVTALSDCLPDDLVLPMEIMPKHAITFFEGQVDSAAVFVKFGKEPFVPRILGATASEDSGVTVQSPTDLGPDLIIHAKKPKPGPYTLVVTDADGQTAQKTFSVTAGPLEIGQGNDGDDEPTVCPDVDGLVITANPLTDFEECKPRSDGKQLQQALCLRNEDGTFNSPGVLGPATRLAICQWRRDQVNNDCAGPDERGLSQQEFTDITTAGACKTARRSWLESVRPTDRMLALLERVGVDMSVFAAGGLSDSQEEAELRKRLADPKVRAKIEAFSKLKKLKPVLEKDPDPNSTETETREVISQELIDAFAAHPDITAADTKAAREKLCVKDSATAAAETTAAIKQLHADYAGTGVGNDQGELNWHVVMFLIDKPKCADGLNSYYENDKANKTQVELVLDKAGVSPPTIDQLTGAAAAAERAKVKVFKATKATAANGIDKDSDLITRKLLKAL